MSNPLTTTPKSLKLEFSKAADNVRLAALLDPKVKDAFDPNTFVNKRLSGAFNKAVAEGCAVFLSDELGQARVLTVGYHLHDLKNPPADAPHDNTEVGTSFSTVPGYKSSVPVVAALALREWYNHPPQKRMAADIKAENGPSVKIYTRELGWTKVADKSGDCGLLDDASWRIVPDPSDPTGQKGYDKPPVKSQTMDWYECGDAAIVKQAQLLLAFMKAGGIRNDKTGDFIPVDFSAIEKEGLTKKRLEAIAGGVTNRQKLAAL